MPMTDKPPPDRSEPASDDPAASSAAEPQRDTVTVYPAVAGLLIAAPARRRSPTQDRHAT